MCGWIGNGIPARTPSLITSVWKLLGAIGPPLSEVKDIRAGRLFALQAAQGTDLVTSDWMDARGASLASADGSRGALWAGFSRA